MSKNIVLLSDGTGNSSAQLLKTNVWRVYESLQLTDPTKQVACYDDGIGTSSFKPLALLGGAFGIGLRRNVLRLYRFLCEHYDPGDQIFMFGFSRGAFTIRVLNALICREGIIKTRPTMPVVGATVMGPNAGVTVAGGVAVATAPMPPVTKDLVYGSELGRLARWAYRDFRKVFDQTGDVVTLARTLRDGVFRLWDGARGLEPYDRSLNHVVDKIAFLGLWDTVDAYGMPIDELTNGIDRWVWPLSMPELALSDKVTRACHVLALDDERNTFHPVLWDERASNQRQNCTDIKDERITQVWFAGMHSNVGGGYPDDALSAVSLGWMMKQVSTQLLFVQQLYEHHTAKADPLGRVYDSRSGVKGYYRYNPRKIEWLTNGQRHEHVPERFTKSWQVHIERPKIHESVFTRMSAAPEAYAPIVLPRHYAVVMEDGRIVEGKANPFESPEAADKRIAAQEAAWDLVWWRRVVYFTAVGVTLVLLSRPFGTGAEAALATPDTGTAGRIVLAVGAWLPWFASPWTGYFTARPWELLSGLLALVGLSRTGTWLQAKISRTMRGIWLNVIPPAIDEYKTLPAHTSWLTTMRSSAGYQGLFGALRRVALPTAFGLATLVCLIAVANRAVFETVSALGGICAGSGVVQGLAVGESSPPLRWASADPCASSGVRLDAGTRYALQVAIDTGTGMPWRDGTVEPGHVTLRQRLVFAGAAPFRRLWSADWFMPVARIGERGVDHYPLAGETVTITAKTTGELFLFVNDAIWFLSPTPIAWGWDAFYANNRGTAAVTVTRLPETP